MPLPVNPVFLQDGQGFVEMPDLSSDDDDEMDEAMQMAILADAAFNPF